NPYAWLLSLYERPYHQHHTKSMTFEEFLVHPWKLVRRDNCPGAFLNSPMTLWNIKNQSYLSLEGPHCLATSSEQLLENPARVIDSIATAFQVPKVSESFVNFEESTNVAGKTYSDYRDYYLEEKWKRLLTPESIRVINGQLDAGLVESLGYKLLEPFESQDSVPLNSR
ncbi:MAG: hypothetical protein O3B72_05915, partial [Proteobacteria bacterium]|nr:hypothetical protein [Pseudomonadota bacterium]